MLGSVQKPCSASTTSRNSWSPWGFRNPKSALTGCVDPRNADAWAIQTKREENEILGGEMGITLFRHAARLDVVGDKSVNNASPNGGDDFLTL